MTVHLFRSKQTSEVMRSKMASVKAALSVRRPTVCSFWISVFLLLILIQMLTSLVLYAGVFIISDEAHISPFLFCLRHQHSELPFDKSYRIPVDGAECEVKTSILKTVAILCLYTPVLLVAFALLATLFAAYAKDSATLRLSMACQAASSLLVPTGIIAFLVLSRSYVTWEHMTLWFYVCVGVEVQLVIVTALTRESARRLTSDWEEIRPNEKSSSPC